jgi:hypothetical protein
MKRRIERKSSVEHVEFQTSPAPQSIESAPKKNLQPTSGPILSLTLLICYVSHQKWFNACQIELFYRNNGQHRSLGLGRSVAVFLPHQPSDGGAWLGNSQLNLYHLMKIDVLIIGGGPGGAAAAMFLLREGITPVILEQEEFPRFHIGESLTGEGGQVLRRLGLAEKMDAMANPVKHGVRVYGTNATNSWYVKVSSRDQDWILADSTTWQVRRSEFDTMMLKEAEARGAKIMRGTATKALLNYDDSLRGIAIRRPDGTEEEIETKMVLDCSGQSTFLANQKVTGPKYMGS